jgi:tetratricopeptide (TPR) repeat protein
LRIDTVEAPMGFRQIQAIDFGDWRNDPLSPAFASLTTSVRELLARDGSLPVPVATKPSLRARARSFALRRRAPLFAGFALVVGVLATWAFINSSYAPGAHVVVMGEVEVQPFIASPADPARAARAASYAGAFRQRFTELGIRNFPASAARKMGESELILVGELNDEGGRNILTARIDDRKSGAILWSVRREPTEGAAWESNLAGFALKCALKRRDPRLGTDAFSHYVYGCAHFLERNFGALHAVAKELYEAAPKNPNVLAFYAFADAGAGWSEARSKAEHDRLIAEGSRLAELALKLDPHNADALFTMGFAKDDFQFREQEKWWRRAIEADPELGWALGRYANLLTAVGRVREAIDIGLRAQLHRRVPDVAVARLLASSGDLLEAKVQYDLVRSMDPEQVDSAEMTTEVLYGDVDAALKKLREHPALGGGGVACWTQILAARRKEPLDRARFAKDCRASGEISVRALALGGDLDAAYREMDLYLKSGERFAPHLFWPEMHDFIRDPRFWSLAARIGLVDYWLDTNQWPDFCAEPDLPFNCTVEAAKVRAARTPAWTPA